MYTSPNDITAFNEQDIEAVLTDELADSEDRYESVNSPTAVLLAGQPGAGKTELASAMSGMLDYNAFFINADEYRRRHPNYRAIYEHYGSDAVQMTSAFSSVVTERIIKAFSKRHPNLIIEGTGRTVKVPKNTARFLTSEGYTVDLAVLAVRPEMSLASTLLRFYQMNEGGTIPRATAVESHDAVVKALPENLNILCAEPTISRLTIWNRELHRLYDSTFDTIAPSDVLTQLWNCPWSAEELQKTQETICFLRQREATSQLGQSRVIDELERRVSSVELKKLREGLGMAMY